MARAESPQASLEQVLAEVEFGADRAADAIAKALGAAARHVLGAVELLEEGCTIPFIARYRKERTGAMNEIALRQVEDSLHALRELAKRKAAVLKSIFEQGKLTAELRRRLVDCGDKKTLEELYLPYKPKRRTRAALARERGLEPLALLLREQQTAAGAAEALLRPFVAPDKEVPDIEAALRGACDIVAEEWADDAPTRRFVEDRLRRGELKSGVKREHKDKPGKFEMYVDHREPLEKAPSHRVLAMLRGVEEGVLTLGIELDRDAVTPDLKRRLAPNAKFVFHRELLQTVDDCYDRLLFPSLESSLLAERRAWAEEQAIAVFRENLRQLLLAPPAGPRAVLGVDPGFRTGCKLAVIDATGKFVESATIYPHPPRPMVEAAARVLVELVKKHRLEFIAIGNGTASRETDQFVGEVARAHGLAATKVLVSESGASVYSASELAAAEFPTLDVTVRGAISIARRLQDPLAELVKIDPKSIGVGQYQHDVNQAELRRALEREVESCVNLVGVDLNTASAPLLAHVAGIGPKLAEAICHHRHEHGPFTERKQLLKVPRLGARAFEQCAGFLRVRGGTQPLDASAVHPESYRVVEKMARVAGCPPAELLARPDKLKTLQPRDFVDEQTGLPTVQDILTELEKPGRDPRKQFVAAKFAEGVQDISQVKVGMLLEGVVTNVTQFGAFVDLGVHQDGLIHVSELSHQFVKDPTQVVTVGDVVRVKVLAVDLDRKRIALSRKQAK